MNFEEAFKHYKEGTATDEEREYVQDEIAKMKALSSLLDDDSLNVRAPEIQPAEAVEIRTAKKELKYTRLLAALLGIFGAIVAVAAVLGGVFGAAAGYAKKGVSVSVQEAQLTARDYVYDLAVDDPRINYQGAKETLILSDVDKELKIEGNLTDSYYIYRIKVEVPIGRGNDVDYEIDVNTKTGKCSLFKIDWD